MLEARMQLHVLPRCFQLDVYVCHVDLSSRSVKLLARSSSSCRISNLGSSAANLSGISKAFSTIKKCNDLPESQRGSHGHIARKGTSAVPNDQHVEMELLGRFRDTSLSFSRS